MCVSYTDLIPVCCKITESILEKLLFFMILQLDNMFVHRLKECTVVLGRGIDFIRRKELKIK